ncbi:RNA 2',3'-cyclic phosphodiesterase [bacterium]|nr:RNA 2',3'-cyclic phosphodiesterase [bacterium]MBU1637040.1 RNA 2',3'-cyclic phosphodiesterase [bacterium]MBU1921345.1 RNA 2',3'-cyclic phosphodiesterase [bacterium]
MRLFIAINLPDEWKDLLALPKESIAWLGKGVRWTEPTGMHLTLKFLGDVDRDLVERINDSLRSIVDASHRFSIRIAGTGVFPNPRRPRVFWAGITAPDELTILQRKVDDAMEALGFPKEEREFRPHLTVARIKEPIGKKRITDAFLSFKMRSELFYVDHLSLMRSHLSSEGARYEELKSFTLGTATKLNT